jgi:hypothetical protein
MLRALTKSYVKASIVLGVYFWNLHSGQHHALVPSITQQVKQLACAKVRGSGLAVLAQHGITRDLVGGISNYKFLASYFDVLCATERLRREQKEHAFRDAVKYFRKFMFAGSALKPAGIFQKRVDMFLTKARLDLSHHFFAYLRDCVCAVSAKPLKTQYQIELVDMVKAVSSVAISDDIFNSGDQCVKRLVLEFIAPLFRTEDAQVKFYDWFVKRGRFTSLYCDMLKLSGGCREDHDTSFYGQWYDRKWKGQQLLLEKADEEKFYFECLGVLASCYSRLGTGFESQLFNEHDYDFLSQLVAEVEKSLKVESDAAKSFVLGKLFLLFLIYLMQL